MKHTPGPYEVTVLPNGEVWIEAQQGRWFLGRGVPEDVVNLMDAAPELLEALQEAITWDGWDQEEVAAVWLEQAQAAIAKAMGEGK